MEGAILPKIDPREDGKIENLVTTVSNIASKRVTELTTPQEDPVRKEELKNAFIKRAEEILTTRGVKEEVDMNYRAHAGEGIIKLRGTKRKTPPIVIFEGMAIQLVDGDPYPISENRYVRDDMHLLIIDLNTPSLRPAYSFGPELHHRNRKSFFDMPGHTEGVKINDIENASRFLDLIEAIAPINTSQPTQNK